MIIGIRSHIHEQIYPLIRALTFTLGKARVVNLYEDAIEILTELIDVPCDLFYTDRGRDTLPPAPPTQALAGASIGLLMEYYKNLKPETVLRAAKKAKRLISKGKATLVIIEDIMYDEDAAEIKKEIPNAIMICLEDRDLGSFSAPYSYIIPSRPAPHQIWGIVKCIEEEKKTKN